MVKLLQVSIALSFLHVVISISTCKYKLEPIGCFADDASHVSKRTMPEQILNERDPFSKVHNNHHVNWETFNAYLPTFLCRCATAAFEKGYSVIGAQYYGECWSGPDAHLHFDKYGMADTCVNGKFSKDITDVSKCISGVGMDSTNFVYRIAPTECETYYEPVGCFHDSQVAPRPMPNYSLNERDFTISNWNKILIDWKNWNTYSPKMICRCAAEAKRLNHDLFSIQFWGECWSGSSSRTNYVRDGISTECRGRDFDTCPCNSYHCVGKAYTNYVYKLTSGP